MALEVREKEAGLPALSQHPSKGAQSRPAKGAEMQEIVAELGAEGEDITTFVGGIRHNCPDGP